MKHWTREENDRLYAMWCDGAPYKQIAEELGTTVQSVKSKLKSWGVRRKRTREESAAEVRRLVSEGMTKAQAAKHLGVTAKYARMITAKRRSEKDMNLVDLNMSYRLTYRTSQRDWAATDIQRLRYLWDELGCTSGECAKLMGRTRSAIMGAVRRHNMSKRECPIPVSPNLVHQREVELARIAAIDELMRTRG